AARVAPAHLDLQLERLVPELGEPVAVLDDEVEGEPVAAGRDRAAEGDGGLGAPAGLHGPEVGADPVPEDRVPEPIEPVVGELQSVPGGEAGVLEGDARAGGRPGLDGLELVG